MFLFIQEMVQLYYARWRDGEVDIVALGEELKALWAVEVKWSDRFFEHPEQLKSLSRFCQTQGLTKAKVTTRTITGSKTVVGGYF